MKTQGIGFVANAVVTAGLLYGISQVAGKGVKCKSFLDAVLVACIQSVLAGILQVAMFFLSLPVLATLAMIPVLGWMLILGGGIPAIFLAAFLISAVSLYVADHFVEGFELDGFGSALWFAFLLALARAILFGGLRI